MTTPNLPAVVEPSPTVELGVVQASTPRALVARATEAAHALSEVIEDRKLYSTISGRRFVRAEGWTTLAAMMGFSPRETSMEEKDGTFTATVELVRIHDGMVLTRASAQCGMDEPTWKSRAAYARRSMAATRATSKACRLAFSWVMALTGFEVTPSEEMEDIDHTRKPAAPRAVDVDPPAVTQPPQQPLTERPKALEDAPEPMPWEPNGNVRDTVPCPHFPTAGLTLATATMKQLTWLMDKLAREPTLPDADAWMEAARAVYKRRRQPKASR